LSHVRYTYFYSHFIYKFKLKTDFIDSVYGKDTWTNDNSMSSLYIGV